MPKKCLVEKAKRKPKFSSRIIRRCQICGRGKSVLRQFQMCRICFRERASKGEIPGITKSSW